jgi:hypothetical protein
MRSLPSRTKKAAALAAAMALVLAGCTTTYPMASEPVARFATGEVDAVFEDDGTGRMIVRVDHLGDPGKIDPRATVYVVWVQSLEDGAPIQNVGPIKLAPSYLGKLKFSTSLPRFKVWVTSEPSADATKPSGPTVLTGEVTRQ